MTQLAPPPVPKALREALKDYPEYIQQIQHMLNRVVADRWVEMPPYEQTCWKLEDTLDAFVHEALGEQEKAQASGDPEAIARAQRMYDRMTSLGQPKRDALRELSTYFNTHKEATR